MSSPSLSEIVSRAKAYPDRPSWLRARRATVGGSEIAAIFGVSRFSSSYALWQSKKLGVSAELAGEWLDWGNILEPAIARGWSERSGLDLVDLGRFTIVTHPNGISSATLDYLIRSPLRGLGVLQIKNASVGVARAFRDGCPLDYELQVRQEMLAAGVSWGVLAVLIGGNKLKTFEFSLDLDFEETMLFETREWWDRYVLGDEVPEIDESEATLDALKARFPEIVSEEGTILPLQAATFWKERERLERELATIEAKLVAIESRFRANLGPFGWGVIPGVGKVSRPSSPRGRWSFPAIAEPDRAFELERQIRSTRSKPS